MRHVRQSADWFYLLVALTIGGMIASYLGNPIFAAFGLVIPPLLAAGVPGNALVSFLLVLLMALSLLGLIALGGRASAGSPSAFVLGLLVIALDCALMLATYESDTQLMQKVGGIAIHVFAVIAFAQGYHSASLLSDIVNQHEVSAHEANVVLPPGAAPAEESPTDGQTGPAESEPTQTGDHGGIVE